MIDLNPGFEISESLVQQSEKQVDEIIAEPLFETRIFETRKRNKKITNNELEARIRYFTQIKYIKERTLSVWEQLELVRLIKVRAARKYRSKQAKERVLIKQGIYPAPKITKKDPLKQVEELRSIIRSLTQKTLERERRMQDKYDQLQDVVAGLFE